MNVCTILWCQGRDAFYHDMATKLDQGYVRFGGERSVTLNNTLYYLQTLIQEKFIKSVIPEVEKNHVEWVKLTQTLKAEDAQDLSNQISTLLTESQFQWKLSERAFVIPQKIPLPFRQGVVQYRKVGIWS